MLDAVTGVSGRPRLRRHIPPATGASPVYGWVLPVLKVDVRVYLLNIVCRLLVLGTHTPPTSSSELSGLGR